jgi:hypothetical protein
MTPATNNKKLIFNKPNNLTEQQITQKPDWWWAHAFLKATSQLPSTFLKISITFQWGQNRHRPPNNIKCFSNIKI